MNTLSNRLQRIERETVLKWLVILVSVSIAINTLSIAGLLIERSQRTAADELSERDRIELRSRARVVECFIIGVMDPIVARAQAAGDPVSPDLKENLDHIRRPADVQDAARQVCRPFTEP